MIASIIRLALRHKLLVFLVTVGLCVGGIISLTHLSIDAFPDISPNLVQVFAEVEGMAPEEVEQLVTRSVEIAMRGIPGVTKIRSLSSLGLATVNIYFEDTIDIYRARQLVSERLKLAEEGIGASANMPHGLEMGPVASGMGKILSYYLQTQGSTMDIADLRTLHDWTIKRDIETVSGVAKVISQGGYVQEYQVNIDPNRLLAYNLTVQDVINAAEQNNANVGAGIVRRGSEEIIVRSLGRIRNTQDLKRRVLAIAGDRPIYIEDVAEVTFGKAFRRGVAVLNGEKEIVTGGIYKLYGANSFEVIRRIKNRIEQINQTLPEGIKVVPFYDQSDLVRNSIRTVRGALALGLVLVCVVSFLFLGDLRNALVMACSLPFSILMTFIIMQRSGIPGDLISFGGVAIAMGMIIDATIIMIEKIQTAVNEKGHERSIQEIIVETGQEVGRPIVFAIAIIVIVFLPILTLGEVEGKMFRPLALAVAATMLGSLIYALVVAPVFYRILHRRPSQRQKPTHGRFLTHILDGYESLLKPILSRPLWVTVVIGIMAVSGVFLFLGLGREFVPTLQEGTLQCYAYMNPNVSLNQIKETSSLLSRDILTIPEVVEVVADIGYGEVGPHVHHTNYACITMILKPQKQWEKGLTLDTLTARINEKISGGLGISTGFSQPIKHEVDGLISGVGTAVAAKVFGSDMDVLQQLSNEIRNVLADIPGVADLRVEQVTGQSQFQVELDTEQLARYGLTNREVQDLVHDAVFGRESGRVFQGEKSFRILVRFNDKYRLDSEAIRNLLVPIPGGGQVPLKHLARIQTVTGLRQISREETQRYVAVQCNVQNRDIGGFVTEAQKKVQEQVAFPAGYRVSWGGQFELQQAANRRLMLVIPVTLFLVLVMLYGLFNSLKNVLLILLNVPLALVGGVVALACFGETVSVPSSIGFIALFGIALTDGVVLISRFEDLRLKGMSLRDSVLAGCRSKFRPVLMTTLTTALGLLPLILATGTGSEVQRPLAIVVVGGLTSSTLLTLIVIPTLYLWTTSIMSIEEISK